MSRLALIEIRSRLYTQYSARWIGWRDARQVHETLTNKGGGELTIADTQAALDELVKRRELDRWDNYHAKPGYAPRVECVQSPSGNVHLARKNMDETECGWDVGRGWSSTSMWPDCSFCQRVYVASLHHAHAIEQQGATNDK